MGSKIKLILIPIFLALFFTLSVKSVDAESWTGKTSMSTARTFAVAETINGIVYVIGGSNATSYFNTNEAYDPVTNTWLTKAPMPTARSKSASASLHGAIYVIGGSNSSTFYLNNTQSYNPISDAWSNKAASESKWGSAAESVNGVIYHFGGRNSNDTPSVTNQVYNPANNTWSFRASMITARAALVAASVDGIIYAIGGRNDSSRLSVNEAYDPVSNAWSSKAPMTTARSTLTAVNVGDIIYTIGGDIMTNTPVRTNEAYDTVTNTWSTKTTMSAYRIGPVGASVNGVIYVIGGWDGNHLASNEAYDPKTLYILTADKNIAAGGSINTTGGSVYVIGGAIGADDLGINEAYNTVTNTWSTKAHMPTARSWLATVPVNGIIYAIGGFDESPSVMGARANEAYDPVTNTWSTKASLSLSRTIFASASVGSNIFIIGGYVQGVKSSSTEVYDTISNTWSTGAPMPAVMSGLAAASVGNSIYAIGGNDINLNDVGTNEVYDAISNTWSTKAPMPTARGDLGVTSVNNIIYAIGGGVSYATNEAYDPVTNSWSNKMPMFTSRYGLAVTNDGSNIYAIGGYGGAQNVNEVYNSFTNTWSTKTPMPTARTRLAAAFMGISPSISVPVGTASAGASYNSGTSVSISATPASGYALTSWTVTGTGASTCAGTTNPCSVTMDSARTVTANFTVDSYLLTLTKNNQNYGSIQTVGATPSISVPVGQPSAGASYNSGTSVQISATPASGYEQTGWIGCDSYSGADCIVAMNSARTVTATFDPITFNLGVNKSPAVGGTVISSPAGIDCGTTCIFDSAFYNQNTDITLTATPASGYAFWYWTGVCSASTTNTCDITMNNNKTASVYFIQTHLLTLTKNNQDYGSIQTVGATPSISVPVGQPSAGASYSSGTPVQISATPASGYSFTSWTVTGTGASTCAGTTNPCSVTMDSARTVTANFTVDSYLLTINTSGTGSGTVTGAGTYNSGTVVSISATPSADSTFTSWGGDADCADGSVTMNAAKTCTANFQLAYIDCGLKAYDGTQIIIFACEPTGTVTSPLRISKGGTTYGIILVDPTNASASKFKIQTNAGIKVLMKL